MAMTDPLGDMLHAAIGYIPSLIFLTLLFFIIRYVLKLMRGFFAALTAAEASGYLFWSSSARATVNPPTPESKTPIA